MDNPALQQHQMMMQQQQQQHQQQSLYQQQKQLAQGNGMMLPPQPFKGTLPPGTKVQVGAITVTVKRYLSEGGFAHVYLVTTDKPIPMPSSASGSGDSAKRGETTHVLKRMAVPDKESLAGVRREVEVHKQLRNHANIVHFIEASATTLPGGGYEIFILMEYCSGGGIIDLMNARLRDRLKEEEVLKIFGDVCNGLAVMHHLDPPLMHRDLKVENILLAPSTKPGMIPGSRSTSSTLQATFKLCDFGSAAPVLSRRPAKSLEEVKRVEADLNKHTTLQYRAPEMVDVYQRRVIDEKADIWALGVFLYKLCYYTTPFEENGGGPLAILNVQYRIPPQPVYSKKLKDLIGALLREQSTDRPTIDQVIIMVHNILGTTPPPAALHYARQAASGKIATPLPTVVGGTKAADVDIGKVMASRGGQAGGTAELVSVGPTQKQQDEEEAKAIALQREGITPMRRGRPNKITATAQDEGFAPTRANKGQLTGDKVAERSPAWKATDAASDASLAKTNFAPSSGFDGFGDSFDPRAAAGSVSSPARSPVTSPTLSISAPSPSASNFDEIKPPLPSRYKASPSGNFTQRQSVFLAPESRSNNSTPTPAASPLRHSPALPGFSVSPSPRASPTQAGSPKKGSASNPPLGDQNLGVEEGASRFPSVEELDKRYGLPPSIVSPPSGPVTSQPTEPFNSDLSKRASVGVMAGKFSQTFEADGRLGPTSRTGSSSSGRRWAPPSLTGPSPGLNNALGGAHAAKASDLVNSGGTGNHGYLGGASTGEVSRYPMSPPSEPTKPHMESSTARNTAKDWLTGDGSGDETPTESETKDGISRRRADVYKSPSRYGRSAAVPSEARSSPRDDVEAQQKPAAEIQADDSSDDDEVEAPEDLDARAPRPISVALDLKNPSHNANVDLSGRKPNVTTEGQSLSPLKAAPGRIQPPSWLSTDSAWGGSKGGALAYKPRQRPAKTKSEDDEINRVLEAIDKSSSQPVISPTGETIQSPVGNDEEGHTAAKVRAPAWDEDEDEEMKALPKPSLRALPSPTKVGVVPLIDFDSDSHASKERGSPPEPEPESNIPDLMDHDETLVRKVKESLKLDSAFPSKVPSQVYIREGKKYIDASTSPGMGSPTTSDSVVLSQLKLNGSRHDANNQPSRKESARSGLSGEISVERHDGERDTSKDGQSPVERPIGVDHTLDGGKVAVKERTDGGQEFVGSPPPPQRVPDKPEVALTTKPDWKKTSSETPSTSSEPPMSAAIQSPGITYLRGAPAPAAGTVRQRQQSLIGGREETRPGGSNDRAANGRLTTSTEGKTLLPSFSTSFTSDASFARRNEPQIIQPKRPTAIRPVSGRLAQVAVGAGGSAPGGLKPWEREAAAAEEIRKAGIVRSSNHGADEDGDREGSREDPKPRNGSLEAKVIQPGGLAHLSRSSSSSSSSNEAQERFGGVSSLISRWQQNAESNAPGWGRIGEGGARNGVGRNVYSGGGGLGPDVAEEAATMIGLKRSISSNQGLKAGETPRSKDV